MKYKANKECEGFLSALRSKLIPYINEQRITKRAPIELPNNETPYDDIAKEPIKALPIILSKISRETERIRVT